MVQYHIRLLRSFVFKSTDSAVSLIAKMSHSHTKESLGHFESLNSLGGF